MLMPLLSFLGGQFQDIYIIFQDNVTNLQIVHKMHSILVRGAVPPYVQRLEQNLKPFKKKMQCFEFSMKNDSNQYKPA